MVAQGLDISPHPPSKSNTELSGSTTQSDATYQETVDWILSKLRKYYRLNVSSYYNRDWSFQAPPTTFEKGILYTNNFYRYDVSVSFDNNCNFIVEYASIKILKQNYKRTQLVGFDRDEERDFDLERYFKIKKRIKVLIPIYDLSFNPETRSISTISGVKTIHSFLTNIQYSIQEQDMGFNWKPWTQWETYVSDKFYNEYSPTHFLKNEGQLNAEEFSNYLVGFDFIDWSLEENITQRVKNAFEHLKTFCSKPKSNEKF